MTVSRPPIDRAEASAAILDEFEQWWRDPEAQRRLHELWGDAINAHGVFQNPEREVLFQRDGFCMAITLAGSEGVFAFGCEFAHPSGGFASAASITGELYSWREEARTSAIQTLLDRLPRSDSTPGGHSHAALERIRRMLKKELRQRSLF